MLFLYERKTRLTLMARIEDKTAVETFAVMMAELKRLVDRIEGRLERIELRLDGLGRGMVKKGDVSFGRCRRIRA